MEYTAPKDNYRQQHPQFLLFFKSDGSLGPPRLRFSCPQHGIKPEFGVWTAEGQCHGYFTLPPRLSVLHTVYRFSRYIFCILMTGTQYQEENFC